MKVLISREVCYRQEKCRAATECVGVIDPNVMVEIGELVAVGNNVEIKTQTRPANKIFQYI